MLADELLLPVLLLLLMLLQAADCMPHYAAY